MLSPPRTGHRVTARAALGTPLAVCCEAALNEDPWTRTHGPGGCAPRCLGDGASSMPGVREVRGAGSEPGFGFGGRIEPRLQYGVGF